MTRRDRLKSTDIPEALIEMLAKSLNIDTAEAVDLIMFERRQLEEAAGDA